MYAFSCNKCIDVWYNGRFLDKWAGDAITNKLRNCFGKYDKHDLSMALINTQKLFVELVEKTCANFNYAFPSKAICYAEECLAQMMG